MEWREALSSGRATLGHATVKLRVILVDVGNVRWSNRWIQVRAGAETRIHCRCGNATRISIDGNDVVDDGKEGSVCSSSKR